MHAYMYKVYQLNHRSTYQSRVGFCMFFHLMQSKLLCKVSQSGMPPFLVYI